MSDEIKEEWAVRDSAVKGFVNLLRAHDLFVIAPFLSAKLANDIADFHNASLSGEKEPLSDDVKAVEKEGDLGNETPVAIDLSTRSGQIALELLRNARCPACDGSGAIQVQTASREYVTREMAIDAGDRSLEGSLYRDDEFEVEQCQWCYQREQILSEHDGIQGAAPVTPKSEAAPENEKFEDIARKQAAILRHLTGQDSPYFFDIILSAIKEGRLSSPAGSSTKEEDSGKEAPAASNALHVAIQNTLKETPWPESVWPTTLEDAGEIMRRELGDALTTALSGTLMRRGWRCAEYRIKRLLSEHATESDDASFKPNPNSVP